jgi:hypothetical protein
MCRIIFRVRTLLAPRMLAALGSLAVIGLAGCTAKSPSPVASVLNQPTDIAAPASSARVAPTTSGPVQNLDVSTAVQSELTAAYAAIQKIPVADIAGSAPVPGSVYYAYDPATNTHWAMARFGVSPTAPVDAQVNFQDGGSDGDFKQVGTASWQASLAGIPVYCGVARFFPQPVLQAWALLKATLPSYC